MISIENLSLETKIRSPFHKIGSGVPYQGAAIHFVKWHTKLLPIFSSSTSDLGSVMTSRITLFALANTTVRIASYCD